MKKALITGLSGQDGSYLAEYLVELGYSVYGLVRRESATMRWLQKVHDKVEILYGDMRDQVALEVAFAKASPDEVYNLAGQVFVPTSWHLPAETFDINVGGLARMLNIVERTLLHALRPTEILGRWGTNEFLVLCHERTAEMLEAHAHHVGGLARTADFRWWGDRVNLTVSIGAAQAAIPRRGLATGDGSLRCLLQQAQEGMQESVHAGGNRVVIKETIQERLDIGGQECSQL